MPLATIVAVPVIIALWLAAIAAPGTPWSRRIPALEDRMLLSAGVVALALWLGAWILGMAAPALIAPRSVALLCLMAFASAFAVAGWSLIRLRAPGTRRRFAGGTLPALAAFVAAFLIAVGFGILWTGPGTIPEIQMFRYLQMPGDHLLPILFANGLRGADVPAPLMGDWFSADRPPLQTGFLLLFGKALSMGLGLSLYDADGYVGVACQALFAIAVVRFGRSVSGRAAVGAVAGIAALLLPSSGIYLFFPWPKLLAAAFLLTAFSLTIDLLRREGIARHATRTAAVLSGISIALALLSHGGALFGAIPLAAILLVGLLRSAPRRSGGLAAAGFALAAAAATYLPWYVYGRVTGEDRGRLVKWHFAGDTTPSETSTLTILRSAYERITWEQWLDARVANVQKLVTDPNYIVGPSELWRMALDTTPLRVLDSQVLLIAVLFVIVWIPGLALLLWGRRRREALGAIWGSALGLGWLIAMLGVWCLMIFLPGATVPHQGPTVAIFLPAALAAVVVARLSLGVAVVTLIVQFVAYALIMVPPNGVRVVDLTRDATPSGTAIAVLVLGVALAAAAIVAGRWADRATISGSRASG